MSGTEQGANSDDEGHANDSSGMQHGTCTAVGAGRPRVPFCGKPGINVTHWDISSYLLHHNCRINKQRNKPLRPAIFRKEVSLETKIWSPPLE
jgi:hypothetical protein